ncbi:MAG: hypothetical protein VXZ59_08515 [Cyanobacteriota bacterium]|nr:hypothetical protein [Cyanobacteriota bacterium]
MKTLLIITAFFSIANPLIARPLIPVACSFYADSFYKVVDQLKRFNGMALAYPGQEAERNRLRYYRIMDEKLGPLISCLDHHQSLDIEYYHDVKRMTQIQIDSFH